MNWETLFNSVDGPAYLTGDITAEGQTALEVAQKKDIPVKLVPSAHRLRRAGFLAQEALTRMAESKEDFEPAKLIPLYVKTKDTP